MMDKSRGATQIDPLLIVQPANIEGRASAFGCLSDADRNNSIKDRLTAFDVRGRNFDKLQYWI
jgi:hypothetical protein